MSKNNIMKTYGRFDVSFDKGIGSKLYDINGVEYIDFVSGVAVNCLGHSNPIVVDAITKQSQKVMHISNYYWNDNAINLAEKLIQNCDHQSIFFCNSGAEAVEGALKLARKYGKINGSKNTILYMDNSFHGRTMGALSVTGQEKYQKDFKPLIGDVTCVNFNDVEDLRKKFDQNVCGVIIEPIQGEGGINQASEAFLKELRSLCDKFNSLLIFDEIQCGMGRLGTLFAYKKFDIIPDVICVAKALGGGFPIGAVVANKKADVFVPGDHGSTFSGSPLACGVALAVITELVDGGVVASVDAKSAYLFDKLNILKSKYPVITALKGMGLLVGVELNCDMKKFVNKCFDKKLLLISAGPKVLRILPPLNVKTEEIDEALDVFEQVLKEF